MRCDPLNGRGLAIGLFATLFLVPACWTSPANPQFEKEEEFPREILVLDAGSHTAMVRKVLFTPDGRQLISVSDDKTIRVWDLTTGESVRVLRPPIGTGNAGRLFAAALSPDGRTLAVGGHGIKTNDVYLISLADGRLTSLPGHKDVIQALAFSGDGERLVSASADRTALVWDPNNTTRPLLRLRDPAGPIRDVAFSPDGRRVVTTSVDGTARVWSVGERRLETMLRGPGKPVSGLAWSQDGKAIAVGSGRSVWVFGPDGSEGRHFDDLENLVTSVTFAPDSDTVLYTLGGGTVFKFTCGLLASSTGQEKVRFTRHTNTVRAGAVSPDGSLAATAGAGDQGGEIFVWRTANGAVVHRLGAKGRSPREVAWVPDGNAIAWGDGAPEGLHRTFRPADLELAELAAEGRTELFTARTSRGTVELRASGRTAVAVVRDGETRATLRLTKNDEQVRCFTLLAGDLAAVGGNFGRIYLFNTRTGGLLRTLKGHTGDVASLAASADGRYLLSAADQTLRVWTSQRVDPLFSLFVSRDEWIAWTSEGYYAASPGGEKLMGWHVNNGPDKMATFYPAAQFRRSLYRPDVVKRVLTAGSVVRALEEADRERGKKTERNDLAKVLPPKVHITAPAPGKVDQPELTVAALAEGTGDRPVTALRLLLDGRPFQGQAGLKKVREPRPGEVRESWRVQLIPGKHRLTVQADSAVSQALSDEVEVVYQPAAPEPRPSVNLFVLAVGINAYPEALRLHCATADAQAVAGAFEQNSRALFQKVEVKLLVDAQADRKGMLAGLGWLRKEMTQRDVGVVFFAGHGARDSEGSLYLLPADVDPNDLLSTAVPGEQVKKALAALPGRVLFLLDACHAGAAGGDRRGAEPLTDELVQDLATDDYGVVVMCAAMSREFSRESKKLGHGFFTQALVEGISGKGPKSGEGAVYLHHIDGYVTDRVKELTGGLQHPVTAKPTSIRSFPISRP